MNHSPIYWWQQALAQESKLGLLDTPALQGQQYFDIAIVGGGYTGLWTALEINKQAPELLIAILEQGQCGEGASGRNGGCMLTFSSKFSSLKKYFGEHEARRLVLASEQAIDDIAEFCQQHNIDAELRKQGVCYTASNTSQLAVMPQVCTQLEQANINHWQAVAAQDLHWATASPQQLQAHFSPAGASVQPAKLVRGLRRAALQKGITIFEHSPLKKSLFGTSHKPHQLHSSHGQLNCKRVIFATNAWTGKLLPELKRSIVLVSSDMIISEPIPELDPTSPLAQGRVIADSRTFVHYYRSTPNGRIMLGKGGNHFSFANKMSEVFNQSSQHQQQLKSAFKTFFPQFKPHFSHSWTGASDRSSSGLPFFGQYKNHPNVYYGLGYSGNGIVQSYLGGKILASLALRQDNEWSRSGLAQGPLGHFPPEPIRYLGAITVRNAIRRKEKREDQGLKSHFIDRQLAKLAASAGKADKQ